MAKNCMNSWLCPCVDRPGSSEDNAMREHCLPREVSAINVCLGKSKRQIHLNNKKRPNSCYMLNKNYPGNEITEIVSIKIYRLLNDFCSRWKINFLGIIFFICPSILVNDSLQSQIPVQLRCVSVKTVDF